jgi:serine/threonine protein kinase
MHKRAGWQDISEGYSFYQDEAVMEIQSSLVSTLPMPTRAPASDSLIGQILDSRYEILACLGKGSTGTVYLARRAFLLDYVAVKVLYQCYAADPIIVERFRREVRATAQLNDPHVVKIYNYCEMPESGLIFLAMQYIIGRSLRDVLKNEGPLTPARAVALMLEICAGVGAAHLEGIIHRDLKPDNVMLHELKEGRLIPVVVDFGICKMPELSAEQILTQPGVMIGTPCYMSPEQCKGFSLNARADVYSLGAMLYEMISGQPPFVASTAVEVMMKHLIQEPTPLPARLGVSPELSSVILRALSKSPEARQADALEFAQELQAAFNTPNASSQRQWWKEVMNMLGFLM